MCCVGFCRVIAPSSGNQAVKLIISTVAKLMWLLCGFTSCLVIIVF
ncbi:hypothetical protein Hanom_Chr03g00270051 [Helianthus anomalus]